MSKISKRPNIKMPSLAEDRAITRAATSDPDAQPLTDTQLQSMVPMIALRGRPRLAKPKQLVSIRYSREVLDYFRSTGEGWQSRMDTVLKRYVSRKSKNSADSIA
ncbi:MAG: BrnA antitoxin family protein [Pyrinomonadaceae bacterium]|nr:BrnA antitoxin family protein [Pyrinomonadaceae bacterium]